MAEERRRAEPSPLTHLDWGTHFCCFYETKSDYLDLVIPFFEDGLAQKEFCIWFLSSADPVSKDEARDALRSNVAHFERYVAEGRIEILSEKEWFLFTGTYELERVIHQLTEKLRHATERGYAGLRGSGSPIWLRKKNPRDFRDYEERLDGLITHSRMKILCMFSLPGSDASDVLDATYTHETTVVRRQGKMELLETPKLRNAKQEILRLNQELEQRIRERTRELAATNEMLRSEVAEHSRAERDLRAQKEILQKIFDHIPAMINFVDANGRIRFVNREWERVLGWTLREIEEQGLDIFAECYPEPRYRRRVLDFVVSSKGKWYDLKTRVRSGRIIDTTWAVVRLSDGTSIGIGQDITERKRAEEKLRHALDQLRSLAERMDSIREEEKRHFALEIHDGIGQVLTALRINLRMILDAAASQKKLSKRYLIKELHSTIRLVDGSMATVRRIASNLRPEPLEDRGLKGAMVAYAKDFERRTGIQCKVTVRLKKSFPKIEHAIPIFRILQEALTNVARHSQASKVGIKVYTGRTLFRLEVRDNGRGIRKSELKSSLGMVSMKERALLLRGALTIHRKAPRGTVVQLTVPLSHLRDTHASEG